MIRSLGLAIVTIAALAATPVLAQGYGSATPQSAPASSANGINSPGSDGSRTARRDDDNNKQQAPTGAPDLKIDAKAHDQGKKEAPAVAQAAGIPCQVTDGYFVGQSSQKDEQGKPVQAKIYEVTCQGDVGQILLAMPSGPAKHFDCISMTSSPSLRCRLPANVDPKTAIGPVVTAAGRTCAVNNIRGMGSTAAGDSYFEVGCSDQLGFILKRSADGKAIANDCAQALGTQLECKFTSTDSIKAVDRAVVQKLVASSGKACQIKDTRTVGKLTSGSTAYEVACTDNTGFMILSKADGSFGNAVACANADSLAGGCKLTNSQESQTQEIGTYTRLAKASGFNCDVSKYHYVGVDQKNNEVVELACTNRPDGGIGQFPADNSPGHVYDCVHAGALGQQCHLTEASVTYPAYTAALAAKGRNTCKVSNARWLGHAPQNNTDLIETACSDGLPGWVVEMNTAGQAVDVMTCGQAKAAGLQCTLPGNAK